MIDHRRLHVPREDRAILAEPPLDHLADVVARNLDLGNRRSYDLQGRPLAEVVQLARAASCSPPRSAGPPVIATRTFRRPIPPRRFFSPAISRKSFIRAFG